MVYKDIHQLGASCCKVYDFVFMHTNTVVTNAQFSACGKAIRLNVDGIVKTAGLQDATFMSLL